MKHELEGGCYCGAVRYSVRGEAVLKIRCYCRECQYISGGSPTELMGMPEAGFRFSTGDTRAFSRPDIENAVIRRFCGDCGTHLVSSSPGLPGTLFIKVGTLDDPSVFGGPKLAIFTVDKQSFHHVSDDVPCFDRRPG